MYKKICSILFFIVNIIFILNVSYANETGISSLFYNVIYKENTNYIVGIKTEFKLNEIEEKLLYTGEVLFYDEANNLMAKDNFVKNGVIVRNNNKEYCLVVGGDINGDGKTTITDLVHMKSHVVGILKPKEASILASDINLDNKLTITDVLKFKRILVNLINKYSIYEETKENDKVSYIYYKLTNNIEINKYKDEITEKIVIPNEIDGNKVVSINKNAIDVNETVKTIEFGSNMQHIATEALKSCANLTDIIVSTDNKTYCAEAGVLYNKNKTKLVSYPIAKLDETFFITNEVKEIENNSFNNVKNLKKLIVPSTVTSIIGTPFKSWEGTIYANEGANIIEYAKSNNINYKINESPVIEQVNKTEGACKVVELKFEATDDIGISGWAITKKGTEVSEWTKINGDTAINIPKTNITENGNYIIWIKDILEQVGKKEIEISNIDNVAPNVTSIKIISPESGNYIVGTKLKIRVKFSEIIQGTAPTLKLKIGEESGTGTMNVGNVSGTTDYIDYTYTATKQSGNVSIESYSGGNVKDLAGNGAIIETKPNTGNEITLNIEKGVEVNGVMVTEPVYAKEWREHNLMTSGFDAETHDGVDIIAIPTSPIVALKNGTVTKILKQNDIHGRLVINLKVENDDGTIQNYLHLKSLDLEVGDKVTKGQQISTNGCIPESILACAKGTVIYVNEENGRVWVDSGNGLVIRYLHMSSVSVKEGDEVVQGQEVGKMGDIMTKYDPPCGNVHLHVSFLMNGHFINPRKYIYK